MSADPAEKIKELGRFLNGLKKDKSVNALHREILAGQANPLWAGFTAESQRGRYQNPVDFSEHWTNMCRGRKLPKFDRLVLPAVVALSRDEESLRQNLAIAERLWTEASQATETAATTTADTVPTEAPQEEIGPAQFTFVAGQGNTVNVVQRGEINIGSAGHQHPQ